MPYFSDKIQGMVIGQYKNSSMFISFMKAMSSEADKLEIQYENVKWNRYIDNAVGVQLDILGNILGIERVVVDFVDPIYFGMFEDPTAKSFGDLNDASIGGRFRSADENPVVSRKLNDDEYRALLHAKISRNNSSITPDEVLRITSSILAIMIQGGESISVEINETGNASFEIIINSLLSGDQQAFIADLDIIPRPVGVRVSYVYV